MPTNSRSMRKPSERSVAALWQVAHCAANTLRPATASTVSVASAADDQPLTVLTARILQAAKIPANGLTHFTLQDRLTLGEKPDDNAKIRTQEIQVPGMWKTGTRDRIAKGEQAAIIGMQFVWGWTLEPLRNPAFTITRAADENGRLVLTASGPIDPPLTLVCRQDDLALVELRWKTQRVRFTAWGNFAGMRMPSHAEGVNGKGQVWYHSDVVDVVPLPAP